jgi:hypothetical protein
MLNRTRLASILREEGLVKKGSGPMLPEAEFWQVMDQYRGANSSSARKKVTQDVMQKFAPDTDAWSAWATSFENRFYDLAMKLQGAILNWQKRTGEKITYDGDVPRHLSFTVPLWGKSAFYKALQDPSSLPRQGGKYFGFKWHVEGDPVFKGLAREMSRYPLGMSDQLFSPYSPDSFNQGRPSKMPRGWN